jgi:predicted secreted protein
MALAGKNALLKVSTNGTTFTAAAEIKSINGNIAGTNLDTSVFGVAFMQRIQGLKDASYQISGFWNIGDTTGQLALRAALLNDTSVYVQILTDGLVGWQQQVKVQKFAIAAPVNGTVDVTFDLEGTGVITII